MCSVSESTFQVLQEEGECFVFLCLVQILFLQNINFTWVLVGVYGFFRLLRWIGFTGIGWIVGLLRGAYYVELGYISYYRILNSD